LAPEKIKAQTGTEAAFAAAYAIGASIGLHRQKAAFGFCLGSLSV
jgi:alkylated DNA repair dioxygenase AlkB